MIRLTAQSDKNSPEAYDEIFEVRSAKESNWQDIRRWKTLVKYYKKGLLIDLGCLDSKICEMIPEINYFGIDVARSAIQEMKIRYPMASFAVGDLHNTGISEGFASYVVLGEVLEHLDDPMKAIEEAFRILKPGGVLAISVPLEEAKEPGAVDGHRHIWSFSKKDIEDLAKPYASKFKILRSKWLPYRYCWPQLICWVTKNGI